MEVPDRLGHQRAADDLQVDGEQYVAVAVGGNRGGVTTLDGDAVWAFSLNGRRPAAGAAAAGPRSS